MCRYALPRSVASHPNQGRLCLSPHDRHADEILEQGDSMGPRTVGTVDPSNRLDPGRFTTWVIPRSGVRRVVRRSPGYLRTRMGVVALRLRVESDGKPSKPDPGPPHTIDEPGSVSGRPRQNPQPDARVGLAPLSPVECTLRRSDSCVSIHPTEGHRFYWGGRRVRAWWAALQSRFDTDDQPGGAIEIAMTIALIAVVVVAALLLVVTQLSGR